jgi:nicotinamidase-related amidase
VLSAAFDRWLDHHASQSREIQYVLKGENRLTEMYSALAAEVPIPSDPSTLYNTKLRDQLLPGSGPTGTLIVCGQAMSHCVNFTLRDILGDHPGGTRAPPAVCAKVTLLEDGASAVGGFEDKAAQFVADMREYGCRVALARDVVL